MLVAVPPVLRNSHRYIAYITSGFFTKNYEKKQKNQIAFLTDFVYNKIKFF